MSSINEMDFILELNVNLNLIWKWQTVVAGKGIPELLSQTIIFKTRLN